MSSSLYSSGEYYARNPEGHVKDSPFKALNILKMLRRNGLNPQKICEVGCGYGEILFNLQKNLSSETEFIGYEISPQAFKICKNKENSKLKFYLEDICAVETEKFDLLMLIDVFEHVENYVDFLRKIKPKGKKHLFHIPLDMNVLSVARDHPIIISRKSVGHLHYFNKNTALMTLEDCGYKIIDYFYTNGAIEISGGTFKHRLFKIPRKVFAQINKDLAARFLGGFSLMVLTE